MMVPMVKQMNVTDATLTAGLPEPVSADVRGALWRARDLSLTAGKVNGLLSAAKELEDVGSNGRRPTKSDREMAGWLRDYAENFTINPAHVVEAAEPKVVFEPWENPNMAKVIGWVPDDPGAERRPPSFLDDYAASNQGDHSALLWAERNVTVSYTWGHQWITSEYRSEVVIAEVTDLTDDVERWFYICNRGSHPTENLEYYIEEGDYRASEDRDAIRWVAKNEVTAREIHALGQLIYNYVAPDGFVEGRDRRLADLAAAHSANPLSGSADLDRFESAWVLLNARSSAPLPAPAFYSFPELIDELISSKRPQNQWPEHLLSFAKAARMVGRDRRLAAEFTSIPRTTDPAAFISELEKEREYRIAEYRAELGKRKAEAGDW